VRLSPTLVDTVAYTFPSSGTDQQKAYPDKVYYNRKLVWKMAKQPAEGGWLPIVIVR
jgi:hypothetical protein